MLTVSEYARARGVSHQYISRLPQRGMPLSSSDARELWRNAHASSKPPTNPTRIARMIDEDDCRDSSTDKPPQPVSKDRVNPAQPWSETALEMAVTNARRAA